MMALLRKPWLLLVAAALLATAYWQWASHEPDIPPYELVAVDRGNVAQTVSANGQLSPVTLVSVGTQVSGIVVEYSADFNDKVSAGQVLMRLDDSLLKAQLTQSRANLSSAQAAQSLAQANWQRLQPLAGEGFVSQQELDQAQQALADAQARVAQARAQVQRDTVNLGYAVIRSPVSGVVVSRAVDVGQTVAASFQTPELYQIAKDLGEMNIEAYFTESDIGGIRVGQPVSFRVDAYPEQSFDGVVDEVRLSPKNEQNVVTYAVIVRVDNRDGRLLPGMTAYVSIDTVQRDNVLRVPTAALRFRPNDSDKVVAEAAAPTRQRGNKATGRVWQITPQGLKAVSVNTGISDRQFTEIRGEGLQEGDSLVVGRLDSANPSNQGMQFRMRP